MRLFSPSDDFFTDRLCRRYGPLVFLLAAILIAGAYNSQSAIRCWPPSHFTGAWSLYAQETCSNKGQFKPIDFDRTSIPGRDEDELDNVFNLSKMRYLPVVLILQIFVFLAPRVFWRFIGSASGYYTEQLVNGAQTLANQPKPVATIAPLNGQIDGLSGTSRGYDVLAAHLVSALKTPFPMLCGICSVIRGYILVATYLLTKFGYLLTSIIQIGILSAFFDVNLFSQRLGGKLWGRIAVNKTLDTLINNVTVHDEYEVELFPRSVQCDFQVSRLGNLQRYAMQCELSANVMVESVIICLLIWLWFTCTLLAVTTITWIIRAAFYCMAPPSYKAMRVRTLLGNGCYGTNKMAVVTHSNAHSDDAIINEFAAMLLKPDGAFVLEMLEDNVSQVAAGEVVKAAWEQFQNEATNKAGGGAAIGAMARGHMGGGAMAMGGQGPVQAEGLVAGTTEGIGVYPRLSGQQPESLPLLEQKTNL